MAYNVDICLMDDEITKPSVIKLKSPYKNLVLSGGSTRGISQLGALKTLIKHNLLDFHRLKTVVGVSVGSIIGCLIVLKHSIDKIWDFIMKIEIPRLISVDLSLLLMHYGIETGKIIHKLIEDILTESTNIKKITFKQLFEKTGIHYIVVGSCLTTKQPVYFDYKNTPDMIVSIAIRISISIPGLFIPVNLNGKKYVDGSITDNYPMHFFENELEDTIGIVASNECNTDYNCVEQYLFAIINLFLYNYYYNIRERYTSNTILITRSVNNVHTFNFEIDNKTKKELFTIGENTALDYIQKYVGQTIISNF